ncbi:MAG: cell division protein FtsL [Gammaproteobacteria bacterium]|nr:cell division protein FtsL [Gammaproteobacteria bacterium]
MSERVLLLILALAVFGSALALVIARHESRRLFVELQELEKVRDDADVEWGRLQLEEATWGTHGRVEEIARAQLGMTPPNAATVVLLSP